MSKAADSSFDLLKLLDLSRDVHVGGRKVDGDAIVSTALEPSLFEVTTSVPRECQLVRAPKVIGIDHLDTD